MRPLGQWLMAASYCCVLALAGCARNRVTAASNVPPIAVPRAKFTYTGNQGGSLSGYSVDDSTGALTALNGFPLRLGLNPTVTAVDPQSRFLFVGDIAASKLYVFTINGATGSLSKICASPYDTVREPVAIAVDPSGTHVYVAGQGSDSVGGFSLSATGALAPISGSPFTTSGTREFGVDIVINTAGTFLYVKDLYNIYAYRVKAGSGTLTLVQTVKGPSVGGGIALDPHGKYLYAVGSGNNSIQSYKIKARTGGLKPAVVSPMVEQDGAYTISISLNGRFGYTIEKNNYLVSYSIRKGVFTPIGKVYSQIVSQKIGINPSGRYLYVPQACSYCTSGVYNVVHEFSIGRTGVLTKISGSPVAAGTMPWSIAFTTQ